MEVIKQGMDHIAIRLEHTMCTISLVEKMDALVVATSQHCSNLQRCPPQRTIKQNESESAAIQVARSKLNSAMFKPFVATPLWSLEPQRFVLK